MSTAQQNAWIGKRVQSGQYVGTVVSVEPSLDSINGQHFDVLTIEWDDGQRSRMASDSGLMKVL